MNEALEIARKVLDTVLDALPKEEASKLLTEQAIKRQNAAADLAEIAKFGET